MPKASEQGPLLTLQTAPAFLLGKGGGCSAQGAVGILPGLGFPCEPSSSLLSVPPSQARAFFLPFPPFRGPGPGPVPVPVPGHPTSAALSHAGVGGVGLPFPSQRGGKRLISLKVWQLCASDRAKGRAERLLRLRGILRCPRRALPPPRRLAPPKQPRPGACGQKKLRSVGCAVSFCLVFRY